MQTILRVFLLILIIIGFALLLTKNVWLPKLVKSILSNDTPITVVHASD